MPLNIPITLNEIQELDKKYNTPYYLYDETGIKNNAIEYINIFKKYFPKFRQYYAVKALPNPSILKILADCGMGFDCSSPEEIKLVHLMNDTNKIKDSEIIYTSNYTSSSDLEFAKNNNVLINLDDIDGLYNLINVSKCAPKKICFRYNPVLTSDVTTDVKSNNFTGNQTKFGMDLENLLNSYKLAKEYGVSYFGLHTMCASNCMDISYWEDLIDNIFFCIHSIKEQLKIDIKFIDIGGGIGIPYKPEENKINIEELAQLIRLRFDYNMKKYSLIYEPNLYTECGRYITGPYGWLVAKCESIKRKKDIDFYGLDANMSSLMRPGMYNSYHHITIPRINYENILLRKSNVVGTLCENNDWFAKNRFLPMGITKGDYFVIHDVGAHGHSMGFNYNSKLRCPELLLQEDKNIILIRKRETFNNLVMNTKTYKDNKLMVIFGQICIIFAMFLILYFLFY
jgi:diaminopimelate decarboxylase